MKRILIPLDGSPRSLFAVEEVKNSFSPKAFEVILLMVKENHSYAGAGDENSEIYDDMKEKLDEAAAELDGFSVIKKCSIGKAGSRIVECAKEMAVSMIVMTRSTKTSLSNSIGMTASYVIRHAGCNLLIVPERKAGEVEKYRGTVYRKSESLVNLRGRLSQKQSECMLPCVKGDTVYHISVTRGKIRFNHKSYNINTRNWDIDPLNGQPTFYDIGEGESLDIPINAENESGRMDRITVTNRNMKTEAVFTYKITRA